MDVAFPMNPLAVPPQVNGDEHAQGAQGAQGAAGVQAVEAPTRNEAIGQILMAMDEMIGDAVGGEPGRRSPAVTARLRQNATTAYDFEKAELKTPEAIRNLGSSVFFHDGVIRLAEGAANNLGYYAAAQALPSLVVGALPQSIKNSSGLEAGFVGVALGVPDMLSSEILGKAVASRLFNTPTTANMYPAEVDTSVRSPTSATVMASFLNGVKAVFRVAAPAVQNAIENRADGTISQSNHKFWDGHLDGAGGIAMGMVKQAWMMGSTPNFNKQLFLREDFGDVLNKMHDSWGKTMSDMRNAAWEGAKNFMKNAAGNSALAGMYAATFGAAAEANSSMAHDGRLSFENIQNAPMPEGRMLPVTAMRQRASTGAMVSAMILAMPTVAQKAQLLASTIKDYLWPRGGAQAGGQAVNPDVESGANQGLPGAGLPGRFPPVQIGGNFPEPRIEHRETEMAQIHSPLNRALFGSPCARPAQQPAP